MAVDIMTRRARKGRRLKNDVEQKHEWKFDDWKGERQKESGREEGREEGHEGRRDMELERTDVSQEIWRNERSRGRSWRTKLSNEFPLFRERFFVSTTLNYIESPLTMSVTLTYPLHSIPTTLPCIHRETKSLEQAQLSRQ